MYICLLYTSLLAEDFDKIFEPVTYSNMDILVLTKEDKILYCNNDEVKEIWKYYDDLSEESEAVSYTHLMCIRDRIGGTYEQETPYL